MASSQRIKQKNSRGNLGIGMRSLPERFPVQFHATTSKRGADGRLMLKNALPSRGEGKRGRGVAGAY